MGPIFRGEWFRDLNPYEKEPIEKLSVPLKNEEHYEVHTDTNSIKRLTVVATKSWWSKILYFFQRKKKEEQVKAFISETVVTLVNRLPQQMTQDDIQDTKAFFFKTLAKLSHTIFDREILGPRTKKNKENNRLPKIADPKLLPEILHSKLKKTKKAPGLTPEQETERKLERRIEKTRLAKKLGIPLQSISKGASGSYFARDHKMKIVGVFKPGEEESGGINSPKLRHRIKNLVVKQVLGIDTYSSFWPSAGYLAEAMTSQLAEHMGIGIVPRSKVTELMSDQFVKAQKLNTEIGEKGSFQLFAKDAEAADDALHLYSEESAFYNMFLKCNVYRHEKSISKKVPQDEFEMMAVIDGLIANRDRHFENWLLKKGENGKNHIVLIDHQLAFPKTNPPQNDYFYRRNQNKWEILPQAAAEFSPGVKGKAKELLKGENLQTLLDHLQAASRSEPKTFQTKDNNGHSQELAFKQRVAVLLIALEVPKLTIRDYAALKSLEEMQAFVTKHKGTFDLSNPDTLDEYLELAEFTEVSE